MSDPRYMHQERTHPAVYLVIIGALFAVFSVVLVRHNEIEHNRQIREGTDQIIEDMCAAQPQDC